MKRLILTLLGFIGLILSNSAMAAGGCDACAQAALKSTEATVSGAVNSTTSVAKSNGVAIETLNSTVTAGTQTLVSNAQILTMQERTALDGVSGKITTAIDKLAKESQMNTDSIINAIFTAEKQLRVADNIKANTENYGLLAQPLSGEINLARSPYLAEGVVNKAELVKLQQDNMASWLNNPPPALKRKSEELILLSKPEYWDIVPFLQKSRLTDEESVNLQTLLQILVNPAPKQQYTLAQVQANPQLAQKEIDRLQNNIQSQIIHSVLADALADKAPIIPTDESWLKAYFNIPADENGKISFEQFYEAETIGKVTSPNWFDDIMTRSRAGLLREQVYQMNTSNMLLAEILEAEQKETKLLAISVLKNSD